MQRRHMTPCTRQWVLRDLLGPAQGLNDRKLQLMESCIMCLVSRAADLARGGVPSTRDPTTKVSPQVRHICNRTFISLGLMHSTRCHDAARFALCGSMIALNRGLLLLVLSREVSCLNVRRPSRSLTKTPSLIPLVLAPRGLGV